ncbi:dienelactone hydrolase family protein [Paraburkholderia sp. RL17-373-BIF-A]|uniref:dienelactone hydrolase family protein n=1 Tax=Paraburkholderia sp. RL17-373-BIF-A TaxID=3031629 RepID=UPI0038BA3140
MQSEWIALPGTDDFGMQAYRIAAAGEAAAPTVIVLHEIFGVNEAMRDVGGMLAREGFEVLIPDLFWRVEPRISLGYVEPDRGRAAQIMRDFDTELGLADIGRLIARLKQRSGEQHRVGAIGFCIGGKLATLLGARGEIDGGVSFYGVQLSDYVDEIAAAKSRLMLHFGGQDAQIPITLVDRIEAASRPNPRVDVRLYPEAKHGFFNPARTDRHHPEAAVEAGAETLTMLRKTLGFTGAS